MKQEQRIIGELIYKTTGHSKDAATHPSNTVQANIILDQCVTEGVQLVWIQFLLDCPIIKKRVTNGYKVYVYLDIYEVHTELSGDCKIGWQKFKEFCTKVYLKFDGNKLLYFFKSSNNPARK